MKRRDLLSECVRPDTPINVLTEAWCSRCGNGECSRSTVGTSKFERRVEGWEEKLFLNPPKLTPDDSRFAQIVAQKFITVDPWRVPEIRSDWVDPRDLKEPEEAPRVVIPEPAPLIVTPHQEEARPPSPPKPLASGPSATRALVGANAPDQSGKVLRGAPIAPTTKGDPWSPEPPDPADVVVQPGAKIKMGGSGV